MLLPHDKDKVVKEVINRNIKELIVNDKIDREIVYILKNNYNILITVRDELYDQEEYKYIYEDLNDIRLTTVVKHLLLYILDNKKGDMSHLQKAELIHLNDNLLFDNHTKRNLELVETLRLKERTYSLIWLLDKTKTAMGSRTLHNWLLNPLKTSVLGRAFLRRIENRDTNAMNGLYVYTYQVQDLLNLVYCYSHHNLSSYTTFAAAIL